MKTLCDGAEEPGVREEERTTRTVWEILLDVSNALPSSSSVLKRAPVYSQNLWESELF